VHVFEEQLSRFTDQQILKEKENKGAKLKKTSGSMSELLFPDKPSYQSWNIKFGHIMEKALNACIPPVCQYPLSHIVCEGAGINKKSKKKKRTQLDLISKKGNTFYYLESKNNLNLDTTKLPGELEKIAKVKNALERDYPGCDVVNKFVTGRFSTVSEIPARFFKNGLTKDNVIGYNEFFVLWGHEPIELKDYERMIAEQGVKFETLS
jgi:hypothetical protein